MKTEQAKCIVCEKEYPRRARKRGGGRGMRSSNKRGENTLTCSRKCARIYSRVYDKVRQNFLLKMEK